MIEWFQTLPLQDRAQMWTWGAMVLALIIALFKSERTFLDLKRPLESFSIVYVGIFALFMASGLILWSVGQFVGWAASVLGRMGFLEHAIG